MLRVVREGLPAQQKETNAGDEQSRLPGRSARKGLETQDGKGQVCLLPPFTLNKEIVFSSSDPNSSVLDPL